MTASRDQDAWQYALDLGYEEQKVGDSGQRQYVHSRTGAVVWVQHTAGDYGGLQNTLANLRRGAGVSSRGRQAVVNARKIKKTKKGANSARLEAERLARRRRECEAKAEREHAQREPVVTVPRPARLPGAVLKRMKELRDLEGLMRGV